MNRKKRSRLPTPSVLSFSIPVPYLASAIASPQGGAPARARFYFCNDILRVSKASTMVAHNVFLHP
jgi:hypothetical protein